MSLILPHYLKRRNPRQKPIGPNLRLIQHHPLSEGLVRLWPLTDGQKVSRDLVVGDTLTHESGVSWVAGRRGRALSIPGSANSNVGDPPTLTFPFSIVALVSYSAGSETWGGVVGESTSQAFYIHNNGSGYEPYYFDAGALTVGSFLAVGRIYLVVWVITASDSKTYIDGVLDDTGSAGINSFTLNFIGSSGGTSEFLTGTIPLIGVYDRELKGAEVSLLSRDPNCMVEDALTRSIFLVGQGGAGPSTQTMPIISSKGIHSAVFGGLIVGGD